MPYDAIAMTSAAILYLLQNFGMNGKLLTIEKQIFEALLGNLNYFIGTAYKPAPFQELYDILSQKSDVRPYLTGDNDVSGILKPIAVLLRFIEGSERPQWLPHVVRSLAYLDGYHQASRTYRYEKDPLRAREAVLHAMLGINFNMHATPLQPLFEKEPENVVHYDRYNVLDIPAYVAPLEMWLALDATLRKSNELSHPVAVFGGISIETLRVLVAVQSLLCQNQSERIDTESRTAKFPDPTSEEEAKQWISSIVRGIYEKEYNLRLAAKKREEDRIRLEQAIECLVSVKSYDTFRVLLLNGPIVNNQHAGFSVLLSRLLDSIRQGTGNDLAIDKISLLLTGRNVSNPEIPVWNNGNFYMGDWTDVSAVLNTVPGGRDRGFSLANLRKKYGVHKYRADENRHGHGNDFPSFWAFGYPTLLAFKNDVTPDVFTAYFNAHCKGKGCCIPGSYDEQKAIGL